MANPILDRLRYYPTRKRWRLRYPLGDGRYESVLFGPTTTETDKQGQALAVLEASQWIDKREAKRDAARHQAARSANLHIACSAAEKIHRIAEGQPATAQDLEQANQQFGQGISGFNRRIQPQSKLLDRIAELEPVAHESEILRAENEKLTTELDALRSIIEATGRAAATEVAPLSKLVDHFIKAKTAELQAKGRQPKTMTPIRTSAKALVSWLASYSPTIETSADLEGCPRALGDYRDGIVEQLDGMSAGWAKKNLDGPRQFAEWMVERGYLSTLPRTITRRWMQVGKDEPNPTFFSLKDLRLLLKKATDNDIKLAILLGINCAYRESDIVNLKATDIGFKTSEIRRTRHKTGALQCHRLWKPTARLLRVRLKQGDLTELRYISNSLTAFIDATLKGNAELGERRRTAKSLRSTAAQLVELETNGEQPHLVSQMLGHADHTMSRHYRRANFDGLFEVIERIGERIL